MEEIGIDVDIDELVYAESHTFLTGGETILNVVMMTERTTGDAVAREPAKVASVLWLTEHEIMSDPRVQP